MHYLTLDTNTWIYLANGTEPVRLLKYIKQEADKFNITILLPEIVINEWEKNKDKAVKQGGLKHFKDVNEALDKIQKLLGDKGERDYFSFLLDGKEEMNYFTDFIAKFKEKKKEIEDAIAYNIKLIDDLFNHKSTLVIKIKNEVFIKAGQFALEKKAPFKNKNSFADALILFSFIDFVKTQSIEGAIFISYNTEDFCEKKEGEKYLHPDLEPEFVNSKSKFYKILAEALNTIEKDIVSDEELDFIKELQEEEEIDYCLVCDEMHDRYNELVFGRPLLLVDERYASMNINPNQVELEFAKDLPKTNPEKYSETIEVGHCNWCNTEHFKCVNCGSLNAIWDKEYNKRKECESCSLPYMIETSNHHENEHDSLYRILKDPLKCVRCGNELENDGLGNNICNKCEEEYAYGEK